MSENAQEGDTKDKDQYPQVEQPEKGTICGVSESAMDRILNIKDRTKRLLCRRVLNRWMAQRVMDEWIFIKHIPSGRLNVLYQIVLSGNSWDGVYEFSLKGYSITSAYIYDHRLREEVLRIYSPGNYVLVTKNTSDEEIELGRINCKTDEEFGNRLIERGYICKEEFEIFVNSSSDEKEYIAKTLDKIVVD